MTPLGYHTPVSWFWYEFSKDVPGVTTPEQFAGEVVVVPLTAGRPLICRGDKEYL